MKPCKQFTFESLNNFSYAIENDMANWNVRFKVSNAIENNIRSQINSVWSFIRIELRTVL